MIQTIIIGYVRPFGKESVNREVGNEILILFIMQCIIVFTSFVSDLAVQTLVGHVCCFWLVLHLVVNIGFTLLTTLNKLKLHAKRCLFGRKQKR